MSVVELSDVWIEDVFRWMDKILHCRTLKKYDRIKT